jgi:YVTN family beta-propeller protein
VLDATTYEEKTRIVTPGGPGMQIFSPDGKYGYVCSSFNPETVIVETASHQIVGHVKQDSPFCPNIAATADGKQVWMTLKDVGRVMVFDAHPPFAVIKSWETGPITNHVNFARTRRGEFAYVTVGGLNQVKVYRTTGDFPLVATIAVGAMPHGVWPSGDGSRVYVGLENGDALAVIDTATNQVLSDIAIGQAPQAIAYVSNAVPDGSITEHLEQLGASGNVAHFTLAGTGGGRPTSVSLFDQGLVQVLQAAVTGLDPRAFYVLGLSEKPDGSGPIEALVAFKTNPAGAAIVDTIGPIRQIVAGSHSTAPRYMVVAPRLANDLGAAVQVQSASN